MILFSTVQGAGEPVLLLHGMASSTRYWQPLLPYLISKHRVITVDLLGFGYSPKPKTSSYTPEEHVQSIVETLDHLKINQPMVVVGHSMGALLALRLGVLHPKRISKLVLIGMPIYYSPTEAKQAITHGRLIERLAYYGPTSSALCHIWCLGLRPLSKHIAPLYLRHLPKAAAQDSVLHTWWAYAHSRTNVIEHQHVREDLGKINMPICFLYGTTEQLVKMSDLSVLKKWSPHAQLELLTGSHQLPVEYPAVVARYI
jgi:pimeloyl-ACP methyl ester carboxylesterase